MENASQPSSSGDNLSEAEAPETTGGSPLRERLKEAFRQVGEESFEATSDNNPGESSLAQSASTAGSETTVNSEEAKDPDALATNRNAPERLLDDSIEIGTNLMTLVAIAMAGLKEYIAPKSQSAEADLTRGESVSEELKQQRQLSEAAYRAAQEAKDLQGVMYQQWVEQQNQQNRQKLQQAAAERAQPDQTESNQEDDAPRRNKSGSIKRRVERPEPKTKPSLSDLELDQTPESQSKGSPATGETYHPERKEAANSAVQPPAAQPVTDTTGQYQASPDSTPQTTSSVVSSSGGPNQTSAESQAMRIAKIIATVLMVLGLLAGVFLILISI